MITIKAKTSAGRPVTQAVLNEAIERGKRLNANSLQVISVNYLEPWLAIGFEDGCGVLLPVANYQEFDEFETEDFAGLTVEFSGTALCHEGKDLHVSIAGMICASEPLMKMAASVIASRNGRQSSTAKVAAARANGKKGGRPRKTDVMI